MVKIQKELNKIIDDVKQSELEGSELKIFIAEKVKDSLKILIKYFNLYIEKQSKKNQSKKNNNQLQIKNKKKTDKNFYYSELTPQMIEKILSGKKIPS